MAPRLTVRYTRSPIVPELQSYDLRVQVVDADNISQDVFVIQRGVAPAQELGGDPTDRFICIADPVDLEEFPVGSPDMDNEIPYYRVRDITLRYRDMQTLGEDQELMAEDFQRLVDAVKAAVNLSVQEEDTYA